MFMVSKSIEYFQKFAHGITPGTNAFYMWYFTLTGIHLLHVVVGTSLLTYRVDQGAARRLRPARIASCRSAWPRSGTWSTCCGSCCSPCST